MIIFEQVSADLLDAIRARDAVKKTSLRNIKSVFLATAKTAGKDTLDDNKCISLLRTIAKRHKETISEAIKGGRDDIVNKEEAELEFVEAFLPMLADAETTELWVQEAIKTSGATTPRDTGKVMAQLMRDHRGDVDGSMASQLASKILGAGA